MRPEEARYASAFRAKPANQKRGIDKDAFHFGLEFKHDDEVSAERFALAACCHENQLTKRKMFFERKKAAKRNVATRQPARDVGPVLKDDFELEFNFFITIMYIRQAIILLGLK